MSDISQRIQRSLTSYPTPVGILIFGSIWGLLESTVGGALRFTFGPFFKSQLHICPCPFIVAVAGFPVMAAALAIYKKPAMLVSIGLVAASFSWLAVPFYDVPAFTTPYTTYPIVNPTIAIVLSSLTFASVASLMGRKMSLSVPTLAGAGALSCMLSSVAFIYIVVYLGAPILTATGLSGPVAYIATNATIFAVISAATLPLGYLAGLKLPLKISPLFKEKPWLYRMGPLMVLILCWSASVVAIAALL